MGPPPGRGEGAPQAVFQRRAEGGDQRTAAGRGSGAAACVAVNARSSRRGSRAPPNPGGPFSRLVLSKPTVVTPPSLELLLACGLFFTSNRVIEANEGASTVNVKCSNDSSPENRPGRGRHYRARVAVTGGSPDRIARGDWGEAVMLGGPLHAPPGRDPTWRFARPCACRCGCRLEESRAQSSGACAVPTRTEQRQLPA